VTNAWHWKKCHRTPANNLNLSHPAIQSAQMKCLMRLGILLTAIQKALPNNSTVLDDGSAPLKIGTVLQILRSPSHVG
jgi:hypothetical protein